MTSYELNMKEQNDDRQTTRIPDLDATGEDWEYECCTRPHVISEVARLTFRAYSPSEF